MAMRLILLLLPLAVEIDIHAEPRTTLEEFLARGADELGWVVLCDPDLPALREPMGCRFKHRVDRTRLGDTYRAILAFFEIDLVDVGGSVRLAVRSRGSGFFRPNHHPVRREFAVLGPATRLEIDIEFDSATLPPRTRDRLRLALRFGLHPRGRGMAARLLGALGPHFRSTADALARALDDEDATVRLEAVRALGEMGKAAHHVRPRLRALLEDAALRAAADRALQLTATLDD
jgi:hypothetical protein